MIAGKIPIIQMRELQARRKELDAEERSLLAPRFSDFSLIPLIYRWYQKYATDTEQAAYRKKFVFLILVLFAPQSLIGARMPAFFRSQITRLFPDLKDGSAVTYYARCATIEYLYYADFTDDVDRLLDLLNEESFNNGGGCVTETAEVERLCAEK